MIDMQGSVSNRELRPRRGSVYTLHGEQLSFSQQAAFSWPKPSSCRCARARAAQSQSDVDRRQRIRKKLRQSLVQLEHSFANFAAQWTGKTSFLQSHSPMQLTSHAAEPPGDRAAKQDSRPAFTPGGTRRVSIPSKHCGQLASEGWAVCNQCKLSAYYSSHPYTSLPTLIHRLMRSNSLHGANRTVLIMHEWMCVHLSHWLRWTG